MRLPFLAYMVNTVTKLSILIEERINSQNLFQATVKRDFQLVGRLKKIKKGEYG